MSHSTPNTKKPSTVEAGTRSVFPCAGDSRIREGLVRFGTGFALRRFLVLLGWLLLPLVVSFGVMTRSPLHAISAVILAAALWPVTVRSGEIVWDRGKILVRRYFRYRVLEPAQVEIAMVTPPMLRRQSLVIRLRRPLLFSRYVYCRLAPGSVGDAWALVYENGWAVRGEESGR